MGTYSIVKIGNREYSKLEKEKGTLRLSVRWGRAFLQSPVVVDLLVAQVLEDEPVVEGKLQYLSL